jgi:type III secretion protein Q
LNTVARLRRAGLAARQARADGRRRYVRQRLESANHALELLVELESWLNRHLPELDGLAWSQAGDELLLDLLATLELKLESPRGWLIQDNLMVLGLVQTDDLMLALGMEHGEVFCTTLPEALIPPCAPPAWLADWPMPVTLALGRQMLSPALLAQIEPGDVLLLQHPQRYLSCHGRVLYRYSIQQEHIMIEAPLALEAAPAFDDGALSCQQIPLQVEFVLQECTLTLAELSALSPGQVLELGADAERNVLLRANGVALARGELVELDRRLGLEIHTLLRGV